MGNKVDKTPKYSGSRPKCLGFYKAQDTDCMYCSFLAECNRIIDSRFANNSSWYDLEVKKDG